jgi:hypothetical protein
MPARLLAILTISAAVLAATPSAHADEPLLCVDHEGVYVRDFTYDPPMVCVL